jgi:hypothetical protein
MVLALPRLLPPLPLLRRCAPLALALLAACTQPEARRPTPPEAAVPTPPVAEQRAHEVTGAGRRRVDEYYWLRDDARTRPDVIAYLEAENAYAKAMLEPTEALQETLGGLTEMRKIAALLSVYGLPLVPHANETCRNAMHLLFAQPARICPLGEWGVKINHNVQFFYRDFYEPVDGYFELPTGPGFGCEIDAAKIVRRREIEA